MGLSNMVADGTIKALQWYILHKAGRCVMEVIVHLRPEDIDRDFVLAVFEIQSDKILTIEVKDLPRNWNNKAEVARLRKIGNKFIKDGAYLLMSVPSVILEEECNFVCNANHPDVERIKLIEKRIFRFDSRLKK